MELKKGDIIIFKSEGDPLSKAITWLTDSDVVHAAMVYDKSSIVETIASGVTVNPVRFIPGEEVHIMRLNHPADPLPLIKTADAYKAAGTRYDFVGLVLLGGLLVFRKLHPCAVLFPVVNQILMSACLKLDEFIHHALLHHEDPGMVCSQFVYQVYYDCGENYRIQIEGGTFQSGSLPDASGSDQITDGTKTLRLADYVKKTSIEPLPPVNASPFLTEETLEELCRALSEANSMAATDSLSFQLPFRETVKLAGGFIARAEKLMEVTGTDMPLESLFITPADIAYHAINLQTAGYAAVERIKTPAD